MGLITLGFVAFLFVALFWVAWAVMWLVVALFWLAWPLTLLFLAAIAWRAQSRYWSRSDARASAEPGVAPGQSGNRAFDEYREETLRHLDDEREKFGAFLDRLRKSKDREAFDSYMAERRGRPSNGAQGLIA